MSESTAEPSDGAERTPRPAPRPRHRPAWIVFVVLGAIFCLGMAWWQFTRFTSATGNAQNLGYTFMWPFLAWFLGYAYLRYVRLEAEDEARRAAVADAATAPRDDDEGYAGAAVGAAPAPGSPAPGRARRRDAAAGPPTEIPADLLPSRPEPAAHAGEDETLRAYNEYLAELARRDAESGR